MSDWNEDRLDMELSGMIEEMPESEDLEKRIIKSINKRIRKIVLRLLLAVAGILIAAVFIINPLMNAAFFNPYKLNSEPDEVMTGVLRDYIEVTYPYKELVSLQVKKKGFARYDLEMQIADLTQPINIGKTNVWTEMNYGTYENIITTDVNLAHLGNRFAIGEDSQQDLLKKVSELPESSIIYLSVSDTAPKTLDELKSLPVATQWLQVYQPNVVYNGGLSLQTVALLSEDDNRENKTEAKLLEIYQKNLENLLSHQDAWAQLGLCDGRGTVYVQNTLQETYQDAKTLTTLTSKNYCIYGQRDAVLQFLQENELESVYVENVSLW